MPSKSKSKNTIKITEAETLATFQEEIPSIYFSHKEEQEYEKYTKKAEYIYRDHFKFPPKMFEGAHLIDFGAGTGENTIYLANWGATCTLVEMNDKAQSISKEVFAKHAKSPEAHTFAHSSIFDYSPQNTKKYDIVHCRGVLSHTAAKEEAFRKIATFLKPGGYLIFGDPNKAGGFQNMLQRFAVYSFASTPEEMVEVSEALFKEDIDRSVLAIPRTRRAIIFDRWVIQSQDDPSVASVHSWIQDCGLRLYSSYPPVLLPVIGDSIHHSKKFDPHMLHNLFSIAELTWLTHTDPDSEFLSYVNSKYDNFSSALKDVTSYVENLNKGSQIDLDKFGKLSNMLKDSAKNIDPLGPLQNKMEVFMTESVDFIRIVKEGELKKIRTFIENTKYLFKGACGVRHVDFIAYKPMDE